MKNGNRILSLLVSMAMVLGLIGLPVQPLAAATEKTVTFVYEADQKNDVQWLLHYWPNGSTAVPATFVRQDPADAVSQIVTVKVPAGTTSLGYIVYYGDWVKDWNEDRFVELSGTHTIVHLNQYTYDPTSVTSTDRAALAAKIAEAEEEPTAGMAGESVAALATAIASAQGVYDDPFATQTVVDGEVAALATAIAALEQVQVLKVHYKAGAGQEALAWEVWLWNSADGGSAHAMTESDSFGKVITLELPASATGVGFLVKVGAGFDPKTNDITPVFTDGSAEVWVEGTFAGTSWTQTNPVATDKLALRAAITAANAVDLSDKSQASAKVFTDALAAAGAVANNLNASQEAIDEATAVLTGAQAALVPVKRVKIHFRVPSDGAHLSWDLWIWQKSPTTGSGSAHAFDQADDSFGKVAVFEAPLSWTEIGIIARGNDGSNPWASQTPDLTHVFSSVVPEIWIFNGALFTSDPTASPLPTSVEVTFHYQRYSSDSDSDPYSNPYEGWNIWTWLPGSDGRREDFTPEPGGVRSVFTHDDPNGVSSVGLIVRRSEAGNDWAEKNTPDDLFITDFVNGKAEVWIVEGDRTLYTDPAAIPQRIVSAKLIDNVTVELLLSRSVSLAEAQLLVVNDSAGGAVVPQEIAFADPTATSSNILRVTFAEAVNMAPLLLFQLPGFADFTFRPQQLALHSAEFNEMYYYDGELGAIYDPLTDTTTLRVWAPTATSVATVIYEFTSNPDPVLPMTAGEKGTWELVLPGTQYGTIYRYRLAFADGTMNETSDPYARASLANSTHSVIVNLDETDPSGWGSRVSFPGSYTDAIIYEAHVRDLTIAPDNGISNKGKYLGVVESGTTTAAGNPSGLDYLRSLGITHVQFLPIYDFGSIDETGSLGFGQQYNWGYDPMNYNVPEGSYATDPLDPTSRISELKQMVNGLHNEGLFVIMDVVYNHVYDTARSPLALTVPGYYFRYDDKGNLQNGTGVGNETASEQKMFQKYIVDSVVYWAKEYQIDGFRFDLMGIHDVETMNLIRAELDKIDPSIIMLGEGWSMGNHPAGVTPADQYHATTMPRIAFFNDSTRDAIKGDNFNASSPGFISGGSGKAWDVWNGIIGAQYVRPYMNASQSVVYNEAHDNYTMYDKLLATNPGASVEELTKRHTLATSIQMVANGMTFVHAGQEFLRTKGGDHNSYSSPDSVNFLDYDRASEFPGAVDFFKELIDLRMSDDLFRQADYGAINATYKNTFVDDRFIQYEISDRDGRLKYVVAINSDSVERYFHEFDQLKPLYDFDVIVEDMDVELDLALAPDLTTETAYTVAPWTMTILMVKPDHTELRDLILAAEQLPTSGMTPESVSALTSAIASAKLVDENGDATSDMLAQEVLALQAAMDGLVPVAPVVTEPTSPTSSVTEPTSPVTEPTGEVTEPSSVVTEPSSEVTVPTSQVSEPTSSESEIATKETTDRATAGTNTSAEEKVPETGESSQIIPAISLIILGIAGGLALIVTRKKKEESEE